MCYVALFIMNECSVELIDMILTGLSEAPDSQVDADTRLLLTNCKGSYAEKYDTIVEVSKMDLTKISAFVRELCALDKHYLRPNAI